MKNLRVFLQGTGVYQELVDKWKPDDLFAYSGKYNLESRKARATAGGFKFGLVVTNLREGELEVEKVGYCECCDKYVGEEELSPCKICGDLIADCCQAPYNIHSQIDYTLCTYCYESRQD